MRRDGLKNYSPLPCRCRSVMLKTINAAAPPPPRTSLVGTRLFDSAYFLTFSSIIFSNNLECVAKREIGRVCSQQDTPDFCLFIVTILASFQH